MKYLSCPHIETSMNFDTETLTFCCSGNATQPTVMEFHGEEYDIQVVEDRRKEVIEELKSEKPSICRGCALLSHKEWPQRDDRIKHITLNYFRTCNVDCIYCGIGSHAYQKKWAAVPNKYDYVPVLEDLFARNIIHPQAVFSWGGGEPVISKNFEKVITMIMESGHKQLINSNATVFSGALERALQNTNITCQTSVDAGSRGTYRLVKGRDFFEKVWSNLKRYAATGGNLHAKYIITEHNNSAKEITRFVEMCLWANIKTIKISVDIKSIRERTISNKSLTAAALMSALAKSNGINAEIMKPYFGEYTNAVFNLEREIMQR